MEKKHEPCTSPRKCKSQECGAEIFWTMTRNGKSMPVDVLPTNEGTFVLRHRKSEDKLYADKYDPAEHHGRLRYVCHWATCIAAESFRKPKEDR